MRSFCFPAAAAAAALLLLCEPAPAQEGSDPAPIAPSIEVGGRIQAQFNTTSVDGEAPTEFLLRRARLGADVRVNEMISAEIEADFSGSTARLANAYGAIDFSPAARLLLGRAKRPFDVISLTSSTVTPTIEREVRIRGVEGVELSALLDQLGFSGRDLGVQVTGAPRGAPLGLSYALALTNGPLYGALGDRFTGQLTARLGIEPISRVRVGAAWTRRHFAATELPETAIAWGDAFVLDLLVGSPDPAPGLFLAAQAATGDAGPLAADSFHGAQLWSGYRFAGSGTITFLEPAINLSHASLDGDAGGLRGGTLVAGGVNLYFGGRNRLMLGYDLWEAIGAGAFRTQLQVHF